jgi:hypothetical protein
MGNTVYPTATGDFDRRDDILEYQIMRNGKVVWSGTSHYSMQREFEAALTKYATNADEESKNGPSYDSGNDLQLIRSFDMQGTRTLDFYQVRFHRSKDVGFNAVVRLQAVRRTGMGVYGDAVMHDCLEQKCLYFRNTVQYVVDFLKQRPF